MKSSLWIKEGLLKKKKSRKKKHETRENTKAHP